MWNRPEIKARGKAAFKANYWRCVLVALILFAIIGGGGASGRNSSHKNDRDVVYTDGTLKVGGTTIHYNTPEQFKEALKELTNENRFVLPAVTAAMGVFSVLALAVKILLVNPLEVSCCSFFRRNAEHPAELEELARGFRPEWVHNVVTLLLRDIFIALWSLLLIIPGIVKTYAYRMTPYIMAEHPEMSGTEAITISRQMMKGHKWDVFVYDLSFLGWYLLDAITAGILGVFFVHPYKGASDAELYRAISAWYYNAQNADF